MVPLHELDGTTRLHETWLDNPIIDDNTIVGTKVDVTRPDDALTYVAMRDYTRWSTVWPTVSDERFIEMIYVLDVSTMIDRDFGHLS
jgi:hypothetical protein